MHILMTTDKGEKDVLSVVKTAAGNHERNRYSQRQIDVIKKEIIPKYGLEPEDTGIISPYKNQVEALSKEITEFDSVSVHKFQGKEKDNIIISTVDDEINEEECKYAMNPGTHLDFLIYNRIGKKPVLAIEVDGYEYHKGDTVQALRDLLKNHIMELYEIPLLRFKTNGSGEREKLTEMLEKLIG